MLTLGIDDAGRGPVVGPMILAGCILDKNAEEKLRKLGVRDSKDLTHRRRLFLEEKIKDLAHSYEVISVYPNEIDGMNGDGVKLNELEAITCAKIIDRLNPGENIKVVVDCPSPVITKWKDFLKSNIDKLVNLDVYCEHRADANHVSVSAASILAKCEREREIEKIRESYGEEVGSGYCSDPLTCKFVEKYALKHKNEGIFRLSWETWKKAKVKLEQKKLEFASSVSVDGS